ncbi:MAG: MFS transporter [candidate division KSB1 bacterium]|nr:MFS transporter [candidate division KSB1 bacterium]MDZ7276237.1 MFS transporter [candidate division KSB1 bacterium]MDZ7287957.1 MFS transporter [candidate division KSB1 bacterium]MDZ7300030.1 MFS transporter [candidate division KSB1 bacterium]MDZ7308420.1 MFS transporter [candidate division KSB1 bacterium]
MRLRDLSPFHFDLTADQAGSAGNLRNMKLSFWEGALTGIMVVLTGGVVLTGFALSLGANEFHIGLLAALQVGANLLQIRAFRRLEKHGGRKAMAVRFAAWSRLLWLGIAVVAAINLPAFAPWRLWLFLLLFAISAGLGVYSLVPWVSWLVDLVPEKVRGRFYAQRNFAGGALGVVVGVLAGKFIDWWQAQQFAPLPTGFVLLTLIGMAFGLWAVRIINRMEDAPFSPSSPRHTFWEVLRIPLRDPNFRRLLRFRIVYDLAMGIAGTFYGVYMLTQAGLSYFFVSTMVMLATLTNLLALKPWGWMIDRFGNKPVLQICLIGKVVFAMLWLFTTPDSIGLYIVLHLLGVFDAGNTLAIPNLVYKLAPANRRANYIAVDGTVAGIAATVAPLLGGALAMIFADWEWQYGRLHWAHFHFLFLTAGLLRLATLLLLQRVDEPVSKSIKHVMRVIWPVRSLSLGEGFQQAWHLLLAPSRAIIDKLAERHERRGRRPDAIKAKKEYLHYQENRRENL